MKLVRSKQSSEGRERHDGKVLVLYQKVGDVIANSRGKCEPHSMLEKNI